MRCVPTSYNVQPILHLSEEAAHLFRRTIVVACNERHAGSNALVEVLLVVPDLTNFLVSSGRRGRIVAQALFVERVAVDNVVLQDAEGLLTELRRPGRSHAHPNRQDGIQVVVGECP